MDAVTVTRWWWVRHAPTPGPRDLLKGRLDLPADVSDARVFKVQAARLPKDAAVVTSSRLRARQTFEALVRAGLAAGAADVAPDLDEQDFGRLEGRVWSELTGHPDASAFLADSARTAPPGGESFAAMIARVEGAILRLGRAHAGRDIVAVAHAGTIRAALAVALGLSPAAALRLVIENVSLTRIDAVGEHWRVLGVNWTAAP